ncbi:MAG: hypothetical protein ACYS47_03695, partial [Planctomycetota bacterium]
MNSRLLTTGLLLGAVLFCATGALAQGPPAFLDMDVRRGGNSIPDNGTDSGINIGAGVPYFLTYTVASTGFQSILSLTGSPPVTVLGQTNCTATVTVQPATSIPDGTSSNFLVSVTGTSAGSPYSFSLTIPNNTFNKNPYDWTVSGNVTGATAPEMNVSRGGTGVADGSTETGAVVVAGNPQAFVYAVDNPGSGTLNLTGSPAVAVSNRINCTATVTTAPSGSVVPGGNTSFTLSVTGTASGSPFSVDLSIANDDSDENPYNWTLSGNVNAPPPPEMDVTRSGMAVTDGGSDNGFSFTQGTPATITYVIANTASGASALNLTGAPAVVVGGQTNCTASVTTAPSTPVAALGSTT